MSSLNLSSVRAGDAVVQDIEAAASMRTLAARLRYTSAQRGAGVPEQQTLADGIMLSFAYRVLGIPTGLHEGVLLEQDSPTPHQALAELAGRTGATLLKLTRAAAAPSTPGETRTERSRHWTIVSRAARARELLMLEATFEKTLARFGRHTRRNIRSVRTAAAAARLSFAASVSPGLITAHQHARLARRTRPASIRKILSNRLDAHAELSGRPFQSAIRTQDGAVISYARGYFGEPATAYLLYQLNDPAFNALSPSLLHRAHLMEWLIERGCDELIFVHGCTGVLQHACTRQPLEELLLMRRTPVSYLAASPIALAKAESSLGRLVRAAVLSTG